MRSGCLLAVAFLMGRMAGAEAQTPGGGSSPVTGGVLAGARVGYDFFTEGLVAGGQLHFLLDPWGWVDLMPNAEASFSGGAKTWQANADVALTPIRGLYFGGGAAFRNTIYETEGGRETRTGYTIFAGIRSPPTRGEINPQVELRWTFIGDIQRPKTVTVGVNWPLLLWR